LVSHPSAAVELQSPKFALQVNPQTPEAHVAAPLAGVGHTLLHRPQFATLVLSPSSHPSEAVVLQSPKPVLHTATPQRPATQKGVAFGSEHAIPHPPQLAGSLLVLVHAPEQLVRPAPHEAAQVPPPQICPEAHARPHIPQLALSVWRLLQVVPHAVCPTGHEIWHVPVWQICPEAHARPHIPQLSRSFWRSRHAPVQLVRPVAHDTAHIPDAHT
jgi:hypothetical protein